MWNNNTNKSIDKIIIEGPNRVGKDTLRLALLKATKYNYIIHAREKISNWIYDKIFQRKHNKWYNKQLINCFEHNILYVFLYFDQHIMDEIRHKWILNENIDQTSFEMDDIHYFNIVYEEIKLNNYDKIYHIIRLPYSMSLHDKINVIINKIKEVEHDNN